jgi:hypothetical protein
MPYTDRLTTNTLPRWAVNKFVVTLHFQHLKHQASRHNLKGNDTDLNHKVTELEIIQQTSKPQPKSLKTKTAHEQKNRNQTNNKTENPN